MAEVAKLAVEVDAGGARAGVAAVNRALDSMANKAKRTLDGMKTATRKLKDTLFSVKGAFIGLGGDFAAKQIGRGLSSIITTAGDFESAMNRVQALSGATDEQFMRLNETARELGKTTAFSASQAAIALGFLAMAGFSAEQSMAALPRVLQLASSAQMDLGQAADIASNVLAGYGLAARRWVEVVPRPDGAWWIRLASGLALVALAARWVPPDRPVPQIVVVLGSASAAVLLVNQAVARRLWREMGASR